MDLKEYDRIKFALAKLLHSMRLPRTTGNFQNRIPDCFVRLPQGPLDELPDYITRQRNRGNAKGAASASPALGFSIPKHTLVLEEVLPEADASVLITSAHSPLSEEELRIIRLALASGHLRLFAFTGPRNVHLAPDSG